MMISNLVPPKEHGVQGNNNCAVVEHEKPSPSCSREAQGGFPLGNHHANFDFPAAYLGSSAFTQGFPFQTVCCTKTQDQVFTTVKSKAFPQKLHQMLQAAEHNGFQDIVSWQPHGRAFRVNDRVRFVQRILPKYFCQSIFTSFQRQLNLYCFQQLKRTGNDSGAYYHELFRRDQPLLSKDMVRKRIKGNGARAAADPGSEPDFSQLHSSELVVQPTVIDHASAAAGRKGSKDTLEQQSLLKLQVHHRMPDLSFGNSYNPISVSCFSCVYARLRCQKSP